MSLDTSLPKTTSRSSLRMWLTLLGAIGGAVLLTSLGLRHGGYVDSWPTFVALGGLGGALLVRFFVGSGSHP